ncbi:VanZ family protein [Fodinibius sp. Rm-B-1B1-1]|uniref:VanZ family protein n=1 Tax=Fodinibius alkaliphilus TaxID=3140241 RepID=UPI00315AA39B
MKSNNFVYSFLSKHSYLLPLGVISLTIGMLLLTLLPSNYIGENQLWSFDKLGHTLLFGGWSLALGLYLNIYKNKHIKPWIVFACGVLFGLIIEILQYSLPVNRHADPIDFLFDVIGCLIAVWVLKLVLPKNADKPVETKAI